MSNRSIEFLVALHYPNVEQASKYYLIIVLGRTLGARLTYGLAHLLFNVDSLENLFYFLFPLLSKTVLNLLKTVKYEIKKRPLMWVCAIRYSFVPDVFKTFVLALLPSVSCGQYVFSSFFVALITVLPRGISDHYALIG